MAGIYAHFPFCKSRCVYCGFYSTTSLNKVEEYVDAICLELEKDDFPFKDVSTIYFGGGTPSQLDVTLLNKVKQTIYNIYKVSPDAEVSIEGNPDDLSAEYLEKLFQAGFNRLSMGVQSFDDSRLRFLHRRHTSAQAVDAVKNAMDIGFGNISIDLMFGFPGQTLDDWKRDVDKALTLGVQHISAYSLMYEEGTALDRMLERGDIKEISDDESLKMYEYLMDALKVAGYEHYEISNWAKKGFRSRHNSSYWQNVPYLGVGAAAHSYDGKSRWSNAESLNEFLFNAKNGVFEHEMESLDKSQLYDEFVMTGLRTCDGVNMSQLKTRFGNTLYDYCMRNAAPHLKSGRLILNEDVLKLSREGLFVSNDIMSDLMNID